MDFFRLTTKARFIFIDYHGALARGLCVERKVGFSPKHCKQVHG